MRVAGARRCLLHCELRMTFPHPKAVFNRLLWALRVKTSNKYIPAGVGMFKYWVGFHFMVMCEKIPS